MKVIILWKTKSTGGGSYGVLSERNGPRVYDKDKYDPRSGENLPFYATLEEMNEKAGVGSNHAGQLPLDEAKKQGLVAARVRG